jgi:hypothetical protein
MERYEKEGWVRNAVSIETTRNPITGKLEKRIVGGVSSKAKSRRTREERAKGNDVRYTKVGPRQWAVWTKKRPSGDYDKFKPRLDNAKKYSGSRSFGDITIPAGDIKMMKNKKKKFVPVDPQVRRLMSKEHARVDSTGKRIILPMKRDIFARTRSRYQHRRKQKTTKRYHTRRNSLKYVWPFSLR